MKAKNDEFKEQLEDYVYVSTFAGIKPLHDSPNRFRKVCWAIVIIAALIICLFNINNLVEQYLLVPVVTQTQFVFGPLEFPAVTVCNLNPFKRKLVHELSPTINALMEVYAEAANQVQNVAPSSSRKKRSLWDTVNSDYRLKNCTPQDQLEYKIKHKVKLICNTKPKCALNIPTNDASTVSDITFRLLAVSNSDFTINLSPENFIGNIRCSNGDVTLRLTIYFGGTTSEKVQVSRTLGGSPSATNGVQFTKILVLHLFEVTVHVTNVTYVISINDERIVDYPKYVDDRNVITIYFEGWVIVDSVYLTTTNNCIFSYCPFECENLLTEPNFRKTQTRKKICHTTAVMTTVTTTYPATTIDTTSVTTTKNPVIAADTGPNAMFPNSMTTADTFTTTATIIPKTAAAITNPMIIADTLTATIIPKTAAATTNQIASPDASALVAVAETSTTIVTNINDTTAITPHTTIKSTTSASSDPTTFEAESTSMTSTMSSKNVALVAEVREINISVEATDRSSLDITVQDYIPYLVRQLNGDKASELGGNLQEFIQTCRFQGEPCNLQDFKETVDPMYGKCFTFNWQRGIRTAQKPGGSFGLYIAAFLDQPEYMPTASSAGLKIIIQKQEDPVLPDVTGHLAAAGYFTSFALSKRKAQKINKPNAPCVDSFVNLPNLYGDNASYAKEACERSCLQLKILQQCHCGDPRYPLPSVQFPVTRPEYCSPKQRACIVNFYKVYDSTECPRKCPQPCRQELFEVTSTKVYWPSQAYTPKQCWNLTFDSMAQCKSDLNINYAQVEIYFQSLNYKMQTEQPIISLSDFLFNIANVVGFWLGISIFSFSELFYVLWIFVYYVYQKTL